MPASRARSSPCASARFEITTAIAASSRLSCTASMSACRLLPRPEMSTAMRRLFVTRSLSPTTRARSRTPVANEDERSVLVERLHVDAHVVRDRLHVFDDGERQAAAFDPFGGDVGKVERLHAHALRHAR